MVVLGLTLWLVMCRHQAGIANENWNAAIATFSFAHISIPWFMTNDTSTSFHDWMILTFFV
jgi:hypothetical protein